MISKPTDLIWNFIQMILYDVYRSVKSLRLKMSFLNSIK